MNKTAFSGFEPANTTPVPDVLFDELLSELSGAELKVLLYIIRRTWGFKKAADAIALSQFENGIVTQDGKRLDYGVGLARDTISYALSSLEAMGCITAYKRKNPSGGKGVTVYKIHFKNDADPSRKIQEKVVGKSYHPSRKIQEKVVGKSYLQETVLQETERQEKHITQLPDGNRCSDSSSFSFGSEQGTNEPPPQEKKPRGRILSQLEHQVADAFDVLLVCPINREDSAVKKSLKYLAKCITAGKATLADIKRVKDKLEENPFWQGKVTIQALEKQFSTTLTALATSATPPEPEPEREDDMTAWIRSQAHVSGPVEEVLA